MKKIVIAATLLSSVALSGCVAAVAAAAGAGAVACTEKEIDCPVD